MKKFFQAGMMEAKHVLWLDDVRDPFGFFQHLLPTKWSEITWALNYQEFTEHITTHGLPDHICFDHDLGSEYHWEETHPMKEDGTPADEHRIKYDEFLKEMTGFHAAKWLCEYCMDRNLPLPNWSVHSANPVGAENIRRYLTNFEKSRA